MSNDPPEVPIPRRTPRTDPLVGKLLDGRYRIRRAIARGGMGRIYEGTQEPLGRRVAVKVLALGYDEELDPAFEKRFFLEASACSQLSHPNTVRIFDYGVADGETCYIAMEYIEGETLLRLIQQEAPLDPLRITHIVRQICASLDEAHTAGLVHRDLKPSNVLLTSHGQEDDFAKVLDFGLVKRTGDGEELTRSGLFLGSPKYMSPEQIRGEDVDLRTDIYSIGVILYMCLTGKAPFQRNTSIHLLMAQLDDPPPPLHEANPDVIAPPSLEWVTMTCLEKDPKDRFASAVELSRALKVCGRELRGDVSGPVDLWLHDGQLKVPDGVPEPSASHSLTGIRPGYRRAQRTEDLSDHSGFGAPSQPVDSSPSRGSSVASLADPSRGTHTRARSRSTLRSPAVLGLSALLAVALLLLTILLLQRGSSKPDSAPNASPPAEADASPPEAAAVRLASVPPGAEVRRNGVLLGATPLALALPPGATWRVQLSTPGHEPAAVTIEAGTLAPIVRLEPVAAVAPTPTPAARQPRPTPSPRATPTPAVAQPTPAPPPVPTPAAPLPTPEPTPDATPEPTPAPRGPGSDLRNPWGN